MFLRRPARTTVQPSSSRTSAESRPMPLPAPVMTAIFEFAMVVSLPGALPWTQIHTTPSARAGLEPAPAQLGDVPGADILAGQNALRRRAPGRIRALSPGLPANHPWCEICRFDTRRLRRSSVTRRASLRKAGGGALEARHAALADRNPPEALPDDGGGDARAARHDLVPRLSRLGGPSVARYRGAAQRPGGRRGQLRQRLDGRQSPDVAPERAAQRPDQHGPGATCPRSAIDRSRIPLRLPGPHRAPRRHERRAERYRSAEGLCRPRVRAAR